MFSITDFACAVINMMVTNCSETQQDRAIRLTYLPNLRSAPLVSPGIDWDSSIHFPVIYFCTVLVLWISNRSAD